MDNEFIICDSGSKCSIELEQSITKLYLDFTMNIIDKTIDIDHSSIIVELYNNDVLVEYQIQPYISVMKIMMETKHKVENPVIVLRNNKNIQLEWKIHLKIVPSYPEIYKIENTLVHYYHGKEEEFYFDIPRDAKHLLFKIHIKLNRISTTRYCSLLYSINNWTTSKKVEYKLINNIVIIDMFDIIKDLYHHEKLSFKLQFWDINKYRVNNHNNELDVICELSKIFYFHPDSGK